MKRFSKNYTINLKPGEQKPLPISGNFVKVRTCNLPQPFVTIAFDDEANTCPINENDSFPFPESQPFRQLIFRNNHPTQAAIVVITAGTVRVEFNPSDTRPASTYFKGNLGISVPSDIVPPGGLFLIAVNMANRGTGYTVGDVLPAAGGTLLGNATKIQVTGITNHTTPGAIATISVLDPGSYTVAPATPNTPTGGTGNGAQFNLTYNNVQPLSIAVAPNTDCLTLKAGSEWFVDSFDGSSRRMQIVFTRVDIGNGILLITDLGRRTVMRLPSGSPPLTIQSDGQLYIRAITNDVTFNIGETYLSQP